MSVTPLPFGPAPLRTALALALGLSALASGCGGKVQSSEVADQAARGAGGSPEAAAGWSSGSAVGGSSGAPGCVKAPLDPGPCNTGAPCAPGTRCGSASAGKVCVCDPTGHQLCDHGCVGAQGHGSDACGVGSACTLGPTCQFDDGVGCQFVCACEASSRSYRCVESCMPESTTGAGGHGQGGPAPGGSSGSGGSSSPALLSCGVPGAACLAASACVSGDGSCSSGCDCDPSGHWACSIDCKGSCPPAAPDGFGCPTQAALCDYPQLRCQCSVTPSGELRWSCQGKE